MIDWEKYTLQEIKTGSENGTRLILIFCKEYKKVFGGDCCHTCPSFDQKVTKFKLKNTKMKKVENSGFKLKKMYEGIHVGFNGDPVNNENLTDEKALFLLEKHPKGEGLFDELPDNLEDLGGNEDTFDQKVSKMKKDDLVVLAESLNLETEGKVNELKERIIENGEEPAKAPEE